MKQFHFKYACAKNFVCFGPEGIEVWFDKFDRIVQVKGRNLDVINPQQASNGVGKSTIADIIVYALFGKAVKETPQGSLVNNVVKQDLYVEVIWDKFRVVRRRLRGGKKSNTLQLWESERGEWTLENELTQGMDETQTLIEEKLGMSYHAFVNTVVFTDRNSSNFLECGKDERRGIIDDLFALHKFRLLYKYSKDKKNALKKELDEHRNLYDQMHAELGASKNRSAAVRTQISEWQRIKEQERQIILCKLDAKRKELTKTDDGTALEAYLKAQERMKAVGEIIPEQEKQEAKLNQTIVAGHTELEAIRAAKEVLVAERQKLRSAMQASQLVAAQNETLVQSLTKMKGCQCPTCYGVVQEENYAAVVANAQKTIAEKSKEAATMEVQVSGLSKGIAEHDATIKDYTDGIAEFKNAAVQIRLEVSRLRAEVAALAKVKKPETGTDVKIIEQQIADLQSQADSKEQEAKGASPYVEMLRQAEEEVEKRRTECQAKAAIIEEVEDDIPHWEFLVKAYDEEIRKFIVVPILPALNDRIRFWLQFLMDGNLDLKFNEAMEETIQRAPYDSGSSPYAYESLSGGQQRRLNLAVSRGFAHVMTLSSGIDSSWNFLDEVDQNVDEEGTVGIYKMIMELSRTKQVFVTTHSKELQELLQGAGTLQLEMKGGLTRMVTAG